MLRFPAFTQEFFVLVFKWETTCPCGHVVTVNLKICRPSLSEKFIEVVFVHSPSGRVQVRLCAFVGQSHDDTFVGRNTTQDSIVYSLFCYVLLN